MLTISGNDAVRVFQVDVGATVSMSGLTVANGYLALGNGAGIRNLGTLTVSQSSFTHNAAPTYYGGGIYNSGGVLEAYSCTFTSNYANNGGGISNAVAGVVKVKSCNFDNNTSYYGAGIDSGVNSQTLLTVDSCNFTGNTAYFTGGGIANYGGGNATVVSSSFTNNRASGFEGGGIATGFFGGGTLTVDSCSIIGNSAYKGGGLSNLGGGEGGPGSTTIVNSTIANNTASHYGGGIYNFGALTITNSTVAFNSTGSYGGGGLDAYGYSATLINTLIAQNTRNGTPDDVSLYGGGAVSPSSTHNLIGTGGSGGLTDGVNGNQVGVADPGLGTLAFNGGTTQTIALLATSPAINAGASLGAPTVDQRGLREWVFPISGRMSSTGRRPLPSVPCPPRRSPTEPRRRRSPAASRSTPRSLRAWYRSRSTV